MSAKKQVINKAQKFWTPVRLASTVLVLTLVAIFGVSSCHSTDEPATGETRPKANIAPPKPAVPAPATAMATLPSTVTDVELRSVSGAPIKLANYSGKVLVVNLWATWCAPCRSEIPELVKLYREFRPKGLEVVGLTTEDPNDSEEAFKVRQFVDDFSMSYRVGWATGDVASTLMNINNRNAIPQSFVISRDGRVLISLVGYNAAVTPMRLRKAVEDALNDKGKI